MKNIGKYVIIRSNGVGVLFAKLVGKNGQELELENVRKLYYWSGANAVEELALSGVKNKNECKFTVEVDTMTISEYLQIIPCTEEAINNIKSVKIWKY